MTFLWADESLVQPATQPFTWPDACFWGVFWICVAWMVTTLLKRLP